MSRKQKAFSMAEMLIALLAVSVIVSATIPTFTRKDSTNEKVFNFTASGGHGYACPDDGCSIIIGDNVINRKIENNNVTNLTQNNTNLNLVQNYDGGKDNSRASGDSKNSHLQFFNKNTTDHNKIYSVGRMYFDETNLGIGINVLGYLKPGPRPANSKTIDYGRRNTAFGQLALMSFASPNSVSNGTDNTGIGYNAVTANTNSNQAMFIDLSPLNTNPKLVSGLIFGRPASSGNTGVGSFALTHNGNGMYNTAVGRAALYRPNQVDLYHANTAVGFHSMIGAKENDPDINCLPIDNNLKTPEGYTEPLYEYFGLGSANTAVGAFTLSHNTSGHSNIAVGTMALHKNTEGKLNIALGASALANLTTGVDNIAIGVNAGRHAGKGSNMIAIGYDALTSYDGNGYNIGIGKHALKSLKAGNFNVVLGYEAMNNATGKYDETTKTGTGNEKNVVIGANSFQNIITDSNQNVIIGEGTANNLTSSSGNVIIGAGIEAPKTNMGRQFAIGTAGYNLLEGFISPRYQDPENPFDPEGGIDKARENDGGLQVNSYLTSFSDNVYVGYTRDNKWIKNSHNYHGELHVANRLVVGSRYNQNHGIPAINMYMEEDGKIGLEMGGNTSDNRNIILDGKKGNITISGDLTVKGHIYGTADKADYADNAGYADKAGYAYDAPCTCSCSTSSSSTSSDARLKNIGADFTGGIKELNAIEVKNFTFKKDKKKTPHVGVIAQELQKIFPNAVTKDNKGYLMIRTDEIFYSMVNAIKEMYKNLVELTAQVSGLDKKVAELEKQNQELSEQNKALEERLKKLESKIK